MTELWTSTDLPVLKAAVEICDEGQNSATVGEIITRTGFDQDKVMKSLVRLDGEEPPYFGNMTKRFEGGVSHVFAPTGHARRAVQQWPQAEDRLQEMVKVLTALAEREPDPEKAKGFAKAARDLVFGTTRDVAIGVITAMVTGG